MKLPILLMLISLNLAACANTQTTLSPRPNTWAQSVNRDANLYRVDEKLYRSEQLIDADRDVIQANQIRSIINLRYFDRDDDAKVFANSSIKLINQPLLAWNVSAKDLAAALHQIEQHQKDGAVLVHCYHGADRTGIVVAFYRMVFQNWSLTDAKAEMMNGGFGYHSIWKNLEHLFTESTLNEVKMELAKLRQAD